MICTPLQILFELSRSMRLAGLVGHMGDRSGACSVLVGKLRERETQVHMRG